MTNVPEWRREELRIRFKHIDKNLRGLAHAVPELLREIYDLEARIAELEARTIDDLIKAIDKNLQAPLSLDDQLYLKFKYMNEEFVRKVCENEHPLQKIIAKLLNAFKEAHKLCEEEYGTFLLDYIVNKKDYEFATKEAFGAASCDGAEHFGEENE